MDDLAGVGVDIELHSVAALVVRIYLIEPAGQNRLADMREALAGERAHDPMRRDHAIVAVPVGPAASRSVAVPIVVVVIPPVWPIGRAISIRAVGDDDGARRAMAGY